MTLAGENPLDEGANPFETMSPRDLTVLRLIIRQEVAAGVHAALAEAGGAAGCEIESLRLALLGAPDSPAGGLVGRVKVLETEVSLAKWLAGLALGSSAAAIAGLLVSILTHQVRL